MVDRDTVARRLLALNEALGQIERHFPGAVHVLATDAKLRAAVERWLQVAIEACVGIAYHVIADRGWVPPDTARQAFARLAEHGSIDQELAGRLGRAVGLRNVLVHEYTDVDLDVLARAAREDVRDLATFATHAARWIEEA